MSQPTAEFTAFYEHYHPYVDAFVRRRINGSSVEDVVSDVFAVAWRRKDEVPTDGLPWLYLTARNCIGTKYRTQERWQLLKQKLSEVPVDRGRRDPADILSERERITSAIGSLSNDDRELVILTAWEGLTVTEIGEVLGLSAGNVSVRLHRARKHLRSALGDQSNTASPTSKEHDNG